MFCPNCGTENKDDAKFCGNCGAPLFDQQPEPDMPSEEPEPDTPSGEPEHRRFLSTTAGKVVLVVVIAAAAAGVSAGAATVHHNNVVKEEEAAAAEEAAQEEAAAALEAAAQDEETEVADVQEAEATDESAEEIAVTDDMYPELLEGGLSKSAFEDVLAHGPEAMSDSSMTIKQVTWFATTLIRNCAAVQFEGAPPQETPITLTEVQDGSSYSWDCSLADMNNLLSVLTDYQFNAGDNAKYQEEESGLSVEGDTLKQVAVETSVGYEASITDAKLTGDEMMVSYEHICDSAGSPENNYDLIRTAILKKTDSGRYRVDTITTGTIDEASELLALIESDQDYILPDSDSRTLDRSDLEGLSKTELRVARNELYARHGRTFDDPLLDRYFNSRSWYQGTVSPDDFSDNVFNSTETANRDLIVSRENEMSGTGTQSGGSSGTQSGSSSGTQSDSGSTGTDSGSGFSFADIDNVEFGYSSGAGAWGVGLTVHSDGTFEGSYHDSDAGGRGTDEYGNEYLGTISLSEWTGSFSTPVKVNDYTYSTTVESINLSREQGSEVEDNVLYVYTSAEGMSVGDEFLIYLPSAPTSELGDFIDFIYATHPNIGSQLSCYGLYNTNDGASFISY
ncbi:MAG: YARHG domain-containing protein [Lachnospiraceae bacterium]|nr:YARHG domain-containing protein [Lachnospiraceae bacterium]